MEGIAVAQDHIPTRGTSTPVLMPERMALRETVINDFVVDLPMSVSLEQALEPSYWAHVSDQMHPGDHVLLRAEDGSWVANLVVAYCERSFAKMRLDRLLKLDADTDTPTETIKHKVDWKGPRLKYCVIRTSDSALLKQECVTKDEAISWMRDHERTVSS